MRFRSALAFALPAVTLLASLEGCGSDDEAQGSSSSTGQTGTGNPPPPPPPPATVDDIMANLPASCAFACSGCAEPTTAFACPTLDSWTNLPHADACKAWDGTYPTPVKGQCTASEPTGEAARQAG